MKARYQQLTINGKRHAYQELQRLCAAYDSEFAVAGWEKKLFGFIGEWLSDDPVVEVQTSGSTGQPGKIIADKSKMVESAKRTGRYLGLSEGERALLALPVSFIAGKMMVVRSFVLGLNLVPVNPSSNPLGEISQPVDFAALTPMQLHKSLSNNNGDTVSNNVGKLILGGGEISPQLLKKIVKLETDIWHTYGMAETLTHVAMKKLTGDDASDHFVALPDISFSTDERNCLVISAPWLSEEDVVTNDIVRLINNQQFDFVGRFDNIINSGGIKISPEKLEAKLQSHIPNRFIMVGLPDEALGQKVVLAIEGDHEPVAEIMQKIRMLDLEHYEIPKEVHFLYQFPATESGKVIRQQVREHILNR